MSQLTFDPAKGLISPDTQSIRDAVAADWTAPFLEEGQPELNTEASSPAGQLIDAEVAEIERKNAALLHLSNMFNPKVADGRWQDALGYIYFLTRKLDEPTVATCLARGRYGTVIPYGALVQSLEGVTLICNRSVTINASGTAETTFRAAENGPIPIPAHSVSKIVTIVPGWDSIDNPAAGALGRDLETPAEFEARRYASVAANSHGSAVAVQSLVAGCKGVLDARVLENVGPLPKTEYDVTIPGHGITVCVYGGEDADIAAAIYRKKDAGCDTGGNTEITYAAPEPGGPVYTYKILRPEPVNFWVRVTLGADDAVPDAVAKALREAVCDDFHGRNNTSGNPRVGLASTVCASRFYAAAMGVSGIKDVRRVEIATGQNKNALVFSDVLHIPGHAEPVMSLENVIVA